MKKSARSAKPAAVAASVEPLVRFPAAWRYAALVWALGILAYYLNQYPIAWAYTSDVLGTMLDFNPFHAYLLKVLGGFIVGGLILAVAAHAGALLIQWRLPDAGWTKQEMWALGAALGLGLLAISVLGLGAARLWYPAVFLALLLALGGWSVGAPLTTAAAPLAARPMPWAPVWKFLLGILSLLYLAGAAAPEVFYDSLHYHLAIPNLYRLMHGVHAVPTMLYADFVMNIQMLYGLAITVGNTFSAKALHVGMSALLGLSFVTFGRRFFGSASGWLAAALFFSIPMVGINATTAGTDVAGAFLFFAAAVALVLALERHTPGYFRFAGLLTGIAASAKFPAFTFIPVAGIVIVWHFAAEKKARREWLMPLANFFGMALAGLSPILLKNIALHGNPLYPFGGAMIGHPRVDPVEWKKFISDTSPRDLRDAFSSLPAFGRFLAEPWFITLAGQGTVGPLLLMGLPFIVRRGPVPAYHTFQRYALLLWLVWLFTSTVPRYGLPTMVLLCPLIAEALIAAADGALRWILFGAFGLGIVANIILQVMVFYSWQGWQVVDGKITEDAYLSRMHASYPTPPYDALVWMNQNLPKDAVVLFAGDSRSYYLERRSIPSSIPGPQPVVLWSRESRSGDALAQRMRDAGVTHIFVNLVEAMRTDSYGVFRWDAGSWAVFDDFWSHHLRPVWNKEDRDRSNPEALYVFELVSDEVAHQPHPPAPNPFMRWKPK